MPLELKVEMDPGSTEYLISSSPQKVREAFRQEFPDCKLVRTRSLHSPEAGTTLHLVLAGLSAGAGIVAVEALKEAGKNLWKTISSLMKRNQPPVHVSQDRLKVTVKVGNLSVTTEMEPQNEDEVKQFLDAVLPQLYEINDQVTRELGIPGNKNFRLPTEINELEYGWQQGKLSFTRPRIRRESSNREL